MSCVPSSVVQRRRSNAAPRGIFRFGWSERVVTRRRSETGTDL